MVEFSVKVSRLRRIAGMLERPTHVLREAVETVNAVQCKLAIEGEVKERIRVELNKDMLEIENKIVDIKECMQALRQISDYYERAENQVKSYRVIIYKVFPDINIFDISWPEIPNIISRLVVPESEWELPPLVGPDGKLRIELPVIFGPHRRPKVEWVNIPPFDEKTIEGPVIKDYVFPEIQWKEVWQLLK